MVLCRRVEVVVRERKGKETVADYEKVNTDETGEKRIGQDQVRVITPNSNLATCFRCLEYKFCS